MNRELGINDLYSINPIDVYVRGEDSAGRFYAGRAVLDDVWCKASADVSTDGAVHYFDFEEYGFTWKAFV